jgi:hypothetical protein
MAQRRVFEIQALAVCVQCVVPAEPLHSRSGVHEIFAVAWIRTPALNSNVISLLT